MRARLHVRPLLRSLVRLASLVASVALLFAPLAGSHDAPRPAAMPTSASAAADADSFRLDLAFPSPVSPGEAVPFTFTVTNVTDAPITLEVTGRAVEFDVRVARGDTLVWSRMHGRVAPAILRLETLDPGDALTLTTTWSQQTNDGAAAGPGVYRVEARLPRVDAPPLTTARDTLRIEA